jgi:hypothetical protein
MKSEYQGAPTAEAGSIDPELALLVRNPELAEVFAELHRRLNSSRFDNNLTDPLGSASQQPAAAGQQPASEPDLPEATKRTYPQIHAHVDNL